THTMHLSQDFFDKWDTFETEQAKKTKRARIRYGTVLPKLDHYPELIPDDPIYTLIGSSHQPSLILENQTLPTIQEVRKIIRETGKTLELPFLKTKIFGIENGVIISQPL